MQRVLFKSFFFLIQCLTFSIILSNLVHATQNVQDEKTNIEINVGIYAPFSDRSAFIGRNILNAMEMAQDELKSSPVHYSFFTLDKQTVHHDPAVTLQKFIDTHHINVLLTEGSANGLLAAPLARKNQIIHFSLASDPHIADGTNNFLAWSPADEQAGVLINELKKKNVQSLGVISSSSLSDKVLTKNVLNQVEKNSSINIVVNKEFKAGTTQFSPLMLDLIGKDADLYVVMASPREMEQIQSEMRKSGINKPITTIVDRTTPKVMKIFNGQWYIDTHEMQPEFIKNFQEAYLNYPATEAGYAFDVFNILNRSVLMSVAKHHAVNSMELAKQIHAQAIGSGVMGPFNLDKKGVLYTQAEVKTVKNGHVLTA